jgi:hypothetical protein
MTIWNKVFIGLILLASIASFVLGARALKTHQYWREQVRELEQELAWQRDVELVLTEGLESPEVAARAQLLEKLGGEAGQGLQQAQQDLGSMREEARMGLRRVSVELAAELVDRGRVWRETRPQPAPNTAQTGQVTVNVEFPSPHQIKPSTVLYVFDQRAVDQGGRYLGQFTVEGTEGPQVALKPTLRMGPPALTRLTQSAGRNGAAWSLYERMPADNHEAFAALSEVELKTLLPEETVDEYVSDGQMTTPQDVNQRGLLGNVYQVDETGEVVKDEAGLEKVVQAENVEGKYVRQLRDYEEAFRRMHVRLTNGINRIETFERNNEYLQFALNDAQQMYQYRLRERDNLDEVEKPKFVAQRDTVKAHLEALESRVNAFQAALSEGIQSAQNMAGEIARIQREATRIIDERTGAMARASSGN